ncbi:PEP/pyruvate-binding domain-containing protein [Sphaerisporangium sp. NPDC051017]|uniref:PEP/pyruvate-binding domain-containing protein n=1 Tax=Sphaerisporangium sp. NPDC051017 TaxID=3154636 RepID=UPI00343289A4
MAAHEIVAWTRGTPAPYGLVIRSSAPTEDGPQASFAGLFTSCFATADPDAIHSAIMTVRASADSAALHAYARELRVTTGPTSNLAVIIQPAIRPCCAGVLISQFPTGSSWATWQIEAVRGLADPLTSGRSAGELHSPHLSPIAAMQTDIVLPAYPADLLLPPGEWVPLADHMGRSAHAKIRTSQDGLLTVIRPPEWHTLPILSPSDRDRLLELAASAAAAIGVAPETGGVDLEWAISPDGALHLLQARPLTRAIPSPSVIPKHTRAGLGNGCWQGIPACPGIATGPSLNLAPGRTPSPFGVSVAGAIVICGNLGPDAAAALLLRPAALAATTGGPLSHAAIVARELGVPCVTGLPRELLSLPDRTPLTVDGLSGTVRIHHPDDDRAPTFPVGLGTSVSSNVNLHLLENAAVLIWPENITDPADDGRAATLILINHDIDPGDQVSGVTDSPVPVGFLALGDTPMPTLPDPYDELALPGLGLLAWPRDGGPLPSRLVVLDATVPIWSRPLGEAACSSPEDGPPTPRKRPA